MSKYIVLIETGQKQKYIFRSNKLAENIGASFIIKNITESEPQKIYQKNAVQVIYEGGGNALYLFSDKTTGEKFSKEYSAKILEKYPGVTLYLIGHELEMSETAKDGIKKCYRLLAKKKQNKKHTACIVDFGKTERCVNTNLPAVQREDIYLLPKEVAEKKLSSESITKYKAAQEKSEHFRKLEDAVKPYGFPSELDELGRSKNVKSFIAVVHIDGNRMGVRINRFNDNYPSIRQDENLEEYDRNYIDALRKLSSDIRTKFENAFIEMLKELADNMQKLNNTLSLKENILPIRPLILAGDDICFVSDGRIGVALARAYLTKLRKESLIGEQLNACAGVAIVKSHYPFSKAYELAEQLCRSGKNAVSEMEKDKGEGYDASFIDWHIEHGELDDGIQDIRSSNYTSDDGSLMYMRPYLVDESDKLHAIEIFDNALKSVKDADKIPRSKAKMLREVIRKGKTETEYFLNSNLLMEHFGRTEYLDGEAGFKAINGRDHSLLFDAIEMMDMYTDWRG